MENANPQVVKIRVAATSDLHGTFFPFDFIKNTPMEYSLANISTFVNQERKNQNRDFILLDNGDILQGQPLVYYYNFLNTGVPNITSQMLNYLGYNAATIGNHDIETGHAVYDKIKSEFNFPWLAANAINSATGDPYFQPYVVFERKGIKIAVLGLITPSIPNWLPENIYSGMYFEDMIESAKKWIKIINEKEKPDILIGLFHSGIDFTNNHENAETHCNENATKLVAMKVDGFDLILCGHDHTQANITVKSPNGKPVIILNPDNAGRLIAVADIELTYDSLSQTWLKFIAPSLVETKLFPPDPEFLKKFSSAYKNTEKFVSEPICELKTSINSREAILGPSAFVDLIHSLQQEISGAEISLAAPLSFDATLPAGKIYVRDMFKLYKYENLLYTMKLTGGEIKNLLEYAYGLRYNQVKSASDHIMNFKFDSTGELVKNSRGTSMLANAYYNFESAAGINYTVDISKPAGSRIEIFSLSNGKPFVLSDTFLVALNSYRGNGGGGHLTDGAGIPQSELKNRLVSSSDHDLRYLIMQKLKAMKTVDPKRSGNWKVIPENTWKAGINYDYFLLYGPSE